VLLTSICISFSLAAVSCGNGHVKHAGVAEVVVDDLLTRRDLDGASLLSI
jgi:hypothetical protein